MIKRMSVKKKNNIKTRDYIVIIFIINFILTFVFFKTFNTKAAPILMKYAKNETTNLITKIVNESVVIDDNNDNYYEIVKDSNENIVTIDLNNNIIMKKLTIINKNIQNNMEKYKKSNNNFFLNIPLGIISTNSSLVNLGPKVPVKMDLNGSVMSYLFTEIKEYGINNAMLEIYINVEISQTIIMPFLLDEIKVVIKAPIITKIINGQIPQFYGGSITSSSSVKTLP